MRVLGNDIVAMPNEFLSQYGIEMVSKTELLDQADFISVNCTLDENSYHVIDEEALRHVKKTAILINTARGALVDEKALIDALGEERLAGAAMDVFEIEPLPVDSPLIRMSNVMLSPHNANSSREAWERVHHNTINNLIQALENG